MILNPRVLSLLDFLQSVDGGRLPAQASDFYQLGIDVTGLIIAARSEIVSDSYSVLSGTTFLATTLLTVPHNESWYVHNASMRGTNGTAGTNYVALRALQDGGALDLDDGVDVAAGDYVSRSMKCPPFWLRPGGAIGYGNEGTDTATFAITGLVSRFRSGT